MISIVKSAERWVKICIVDFMRMFVLHPAVSLYYASGSDKGNLIILWFSNFLPMDS